MAEYKTVTAETNEVAVFEQGEVDALEDIGFWLFQDRTYSGDGPHYTMVVNDTHEDVPEWGQMQVNRFEREYLDNIVHVENPEVGDEIVLH
jgi:hypothetical protein